MFYKLPYSSVVITIVVAFILTACGGGGGSSSSGSTATNESAETDSPSVSACAVEGSYVTVPDSGSCTYSGSTASCIDGRASYGGLTAVAININDVIIQCESVLDDSSDDSYTLFDNFDGSSELDSSLWLTSVDSNSTIEVANGHVIASAAMGEVGARERARIFVNASSLLTPDDAHIIQGDFTIFETSGAADNRNRAQLLGGLSTLDGGYIDVGISLYDTGAASYWIEHYDANGSYSELEIGDLGILDASASNTLMIAIDGDGSNLSFALNDEEPVSYSLLETQHVITTQPWRWIGFAASAQGDGISSIDVGIDNVKIGADN